MQNKSRRVMSTASNSSLKQSCSALTSVTSALEVIFNVMRSINPRSYFTYLLTYPVSKLQIRNYTGTRRAQTSANVMSVFSVVFGRWQHSIRWRKVASFGNGKESFTPILDRDADSNHLCVGRSLTFPEHSSQICP